MKPLKFKNFPFSLNIYFCNGIKRGHQKMRLKIHKNQKMMFFDG